MMGNKLTRMNSILNRIPSNQIQFYITRRDPLHLICKNRIFVNFLKLRWFFSIFGSINHTGFLTNENFVGLTGNEGFWVLGCY